MQQADTLLNFLRLTFPNAEWSFWGMSRHIIWAKRDKVSFGLLNLIVPKVFPEWKCHDFGSNNDPMVAVILPQE